LFVPNNLWRQTKKTVEEFLNSKIAHFIFSQSGRNELSICIKDKTYIIDRVVIEKEKITIFDYKTETLNKENIDKYRGKMHTYRELLSILHSLPVESFLVFIRDRKMIKV
jgi:ATP-dependent exoDNAse (exonuclease V) beta subunit